MGLAHIRCPIQLTIVPDRIGRYQGLGNSPTAPGSTPQESQHGIAHSLGPGLITGAADDNCSPIGTYVQAGAQLGYKALGPRVATHRMPPKTSWRCAFRKKATRRAKSFIAVRAQRFAAFAASGWANIRVLSPKVRAFFGQVAADRTRSGKLR